LAAVVIHPPYRVFYSLSIGFCIESAARSIEALADLMQEVERSRSWKALRQADPEAVLNEIQNIIVQGAAVSRYFWPVRDKYAPRGAELRGIYRIQDDSPLRSRELRNAIEHFDERLDEYLSRGIVGNIHPHFIGPEPQKDGVPQHFFRAYFVDSGIFQLLDHRVELDPLSRELWRLGGGKFDDET
jgi:hypothetical protein